MRAFQASLGLALLATACLGDPAGPGVLNLAVEGAGVDTLWVGAPGEAMPTAIRVRVTDDAGRPLPAAMLEWEAQGQGAQVLNAAAQSSSAGVATAGWLLGTDAAEEQRLQLTVRTSRRENQIVIRARAVPHIVSQLRVVRDTPAVLRLGDTLQLRVDAVDPYGNAFPAPDLAISLGDSSFASVAGTSVIGGPRRGRSVVRLASHGVAAAFPLHVTQFVAAIVPVSDTLRFSALGAQRPVAYVVRDDRGRVVADTAVVLVVADASIAQLAGEYLHSVAPGVTSVRLSLGQAATTIVVGVQQRVGTLALVRDTIRLDALLDTTTVNPIAHDSLGSPIADPALVYDVSDERVARFATGRTLEALSEGAALVTVRDPTTGVSTSAPLVVQQVVAMVEVPSTEIVFDALGDTLTLSAIARDRLGSIVPDAALQYSVADTGVVAFGSGAQLKSVAPGQTLLVARDPETGIVGTAQVKVEQRAARLQLGAAAVAFDALGDTVPVAFSAWDRLGAPIANASATYRSTDPAVVTITADGFVTSQDNGSALVIAQSADGPADTTQVIVAQRVTSIALGQDTLRFESLHAVQPVPAVAVDRRGAPVRSAVLTYAVDDTTIATVDAAGSVRAKANGAARLLAAVEGDTAVVVLHIAQRPVRVHASADTIRFEAVGDVQTVAAVAVDSLGSPVSDTVTGLMVADTTVVTHVDSLTVRSAGNGTTLLRFTVAGLEAEVVASVSQVPMRIIASLTTADSMLDLPLNAIIPVTCEARDRNDYVIPGAPSVEPSSGARWIGTACDSLRVARSGFDTLRLVAGSARASLGVTLVVRPQVGAVQPLLIDSLPRGQTIWAPSARRNSRGEIEVYFGGSPLDPDPLGLPRTDLFRLTSTDGLTFHFDGPLLEHDEDPCDPQGTGIENISIVPRADGPGWRMFYAAGSNYCSGWQVFSAVSVDERSWTKELGVRLSNGGTLPPEPPVVAPWPVGEGMVTEQLPDGSWRMIVSAFEHLTPSQGKWQIVEWRSPDQLTWQPLRTVLSTRDLPSEGQRAAYSPTIREFAAGLWRMIFTADDLNVGGRSRLWSAVSKDLVSWKVEGQILDEPGVNYFYSALIDDHLYTVQAPQDPDAPFITTLVTLAVAMP